MKFSCNKEVLDRQLQHISRIISQHVSVPILSNILIETDEKILRLSGTDLDLTITSYLPAEIKQEGTFTIPAKIFQEFIHQNPDEIINFSLEGSDLVCKSNKVEARLAGMDPEDFPTLPSVIPKQSITLPLPQFTEQMKQVIIAAAADQTRPVLTGVFTHLEGEWAVFAATDSFRLVERRLPITPIVEVQTLLIPNRTIQEIIRISMALPEIKEVQLEVDEQQLLCRIAQVEIYSRLLTGNFPKYQSIIPQKFVSVVDVTTAEFIQALRLSTIFSQAGIANVLLEVSEDGNLTISSYGSQKGRAKHTLYALFQKEFRPLSVAFNAKFLLDAAQAANTTHLQLKFSGPTTPLVVATEESDYLQLVMPIRLES